MHERSSNPRADHRGVVQRRSLILPSLRTMTYDQDDTYMGAINRAECNATAWYSFERDTKEKLLQVDAQLLVSVIMAGIMVGIGAYGQRYRHRPLTRFIFLSANTLFLPIISSVVTSSTGNVSSISSRDFNEFHHSAPTMTAMCTPSRHSVLVITWALLVQNIMINTSVVVAVDDREGASIGPPLELLAKLAWMFYLGISYLNREDFVLFYYYFEVLPFLLTLAKLLFNLYALKKAQQSYSFGRNPRLVSGYMQLQVPLQLMVVGEHAPPPLLVMGEDTKEVEKQHHGYVFKDDSGTVLHKGIGLVTLDSIWQLLDSHNSTLLPAGPPPQSLKDLCLSFALFKLLRCRFARYETAIIGSTENMFSIFWSLLLKDGEPDRIFGVIADELSFLNDYYNSSLPISYSKCWLPILGIIISLLSIGYCCFIVPAGIVIHTHKVLILFRQYDNSKEFTSDLFAQIICLIRCKNVATVRFGRIFFDLLPLVSLLVFVVTAEVRDIVSYICSNWTKVVLTCRLLLNSEQSHSLQKWYVRLLRCRCKLTLKHWDEEIGQCSVLPLLRPRTTPHALVMRLLHLPDQKTKLNPVVKVSIIDALRSSRNNGVHLSNGSASLYRRGQQGERFLWACNSKSTSDIILTWQIATSILEVRYPLQQQGSSLATSDGHKIVATHLSRYCAYLVTYYPEMLPDNAAWSKSLYDAVEKDAEGALGRHYFSRLSATPDYYQQLVQLLGDKSEHPVLKDGVKLAKQLVETINVEEMWKLLADFWSEMILYVAPSDNLKAHKESIARGGELITILWALLNHAGIISRTTTSDDAARAAPGTSSAGVV